MTCSAANLVVFLQVSKVSKREFNVFQSDGNMITVVGLCLYVTKRKLDQLHVLLASLSSGFDLYPSTVVCYLEVYKMIKGNQTFYRIDYVVPFFATLHPPESLISIK